MNMKEACISVFANWNNFSGRACRSEFWYFCLALFIASFLISLLETILYASFENFPSLVTYGYELREEEWGSTQTPVGPITLLFNAIIVIPSISVTSRRLQDVSTSGWLQLSYFFIIGIFVVTILCILPPKDDENKWGRNPLLS